jgi:hypothetical protein
MIELPSNQAVCNSTANAMPTLTLLARISLFGRKKALAFTQAITQAS